MDDFGIMKILLQKCGQPFCYSIITDLDGVIRWSEHSSLREGEQCFFAEAGDGSNVFLDGVKYTVFISMCNLSPEKQNSNTPDCRVIRLMGDDKFRVFLAKFDFLYQIVMASDEICAAQREMIACIDAVIENAKPGSRVYEDAVTARRSAIESMVSADNLGLFMGGFNITGDDGTGRYTGECKSHEKIFSTAVTPGYTVKMAAAEFAKLQGISRRIIEVEEIAECDLKTAERLTERPAVFPDGSSYGGDEIVVPVSESALLTVLANIHTACCAMSRKDSVIQLKHGVLGLCIGAEDHSEYFTVLITGQRTVRRPVSKKKKSAGKPEPVEEISEEEKKRIAVMLEKASVRTLESIPSQSARQVLLKAGGELFLKIDEYDFTYCLVLPRDLHSPVLNFRAKDLPIYDGLFAPFRLRLENLSVEYGLEGKNKK
ncbi:hypothetical protein FACS1894120_5490 [Clostridia bacterium]|nr:hypothetical protein FACS1894120_5490 [Clostridia bacterium]